MNKATLGFLIAVAFGYGVIVGIIYGKRDWCAEHPVACLEAQNDGN